MDQAGYNHSQIQSLLHQTSNTIKPLRLGQHSLQGSINQTEMFQYKYFQIRNKYQFLIQLQSSFIFQTNFNQNLKIEEHKNSIFYQQTNKTKNNTNKYEQQTKDPNQLNNTITQLSNSPQQQQTLIQQYSSPRIGIPPISARQISTTPVVSQTIQQQQLLITPSVRIAATSQPNNAEVHHQERPLQVVTLDDMDSRWKTKCMQLEVYLFDLQQENLRLRGNVPQTQFIQDDSKINELININKELKNQEQALRQANKQLQDELDQWKLRYKQLQESNSKNQGADDEIKLLKKKISNLTDDLRNSQEQNQFKDQEIRKLKLLMNDKDNELESLDQRIRDLELQLETFSQSEQQIISLQGEVELWKKKFKQQNEINSDISEKLTMAETQLEALKKSKITVTKESEIKRTGPQGTGVTTQFETSTIKGGTLAPGGYSTYGTNNSGRNSTVRNSGYNDRKQL